ncbi:MAG TPA: hydroxyethylthiazole kinase [bacterium]|nr:hydroxyethylthiazole kinase [bacterium]
MTTLKAAETLKLMAEKKPLIHHITNWVTINHCAQIVRHWGCLPVMAHAKEEVEEMVGLASALVLNIGTLTPDLVAAMIIAAKAANRKGIPVVLDAVGAGATWLRTAETKRLIGDAHIDVLKGNAGEIATIAGMQAEVRGVESISVGGDIGEAAKALAARLKNVVAVTGPVDLVTDGAKILELAYGHPLMGKVVGTGCISASTIGCFAAVGPDILRLAAEALASFGVAGERAATISKGPGDFMANLFNEVSALAADPAGLTVTARERTA